MAEDQEKRQVLFRRGARQAEGVPGAAEVDDGHLTLGRSGGHAPGAILVLVRDEEGGRALNLGPVFGHGFNREAVMEFSRGRQPTERAINRKVSAAKRRHSPGGLSPLRG